MAPIRRHDSLLVRSPMRSPWRSSWRETGGTTTPPDPQPGNVSRIDRAPASLEKCSAISGSDGGPKSRLARRLRPRSTAEPDTGVLRGPYGSDASIILIGMRGTGKSSLAIFAASALQYRLMDADQYFYEHTQLSRATFATQRGVDEYRETELRVMRSMLNENRTRTVITCGPGSIEGTGRSLLCEFTRTNPIILILRDPSEVQRYLRMHDSMMVSQLLRESSALYRTSSAFEFFNISEPSLIRPDAGSVLSGTHTPPSLMLKAAEMDFLSFIRNVTDRPTRIGTSKARATVIPPELRVFTYALQVPLSRLAARGMALQHIDSTADAVEVIVDTKFLGEQSSTSHGAALERISQVFQQVRRCTMLPVIYHVDRFDTNSDSRTSQTLPEDVYLSLLHHGLRLAPEYLVVDLTCKRELVEALIKVKGNSTIIGHYHDRHHRANGWGHPARKLLAQRAREIGCDVLRLCQDADSSMDNLSIQQFACWMRNSLLRDMPLIAYNTGRMGRTSQCFNTILTPVTHQALHDDDDTHLVTVQEAQRSLFTSYILNPLKFGIFGTGVSASKSPAIHNEAFAYCGMPHEYNIYECASLETVKMLSSDPNFGGASITSPFKTAILAMLDYLSDDAKAIGAVNTLLPLRSHIPSGLLEKNKSGEVVGLYGDNTDWIGLFTCISRNLSPANAVKSTSTALVIGAGGMARATIYALAKLGVRSIFMRNRTRGNAESVAQQFNRLCSEYITPLSPPSHEHTFHHGSSCSVGSQVRVLSGDSWPQEFELPTIIVSCVPGLNPDNSLSDITIPPQWLESRTGGVVIELTYNPLDTPLYRQARSKSDQGWIAVDGLQVLPEQAIPQFEMFTGRRAPEWLMRAKAQQCSTMQMHKTKAVRDSSLPATRHNDFRVP